MSYNESLNSNSNYPIMSQHEWDNSPWNEEEQPYKEVEVTVSITVSKTMKIPVNDYVMYEDGGIDFTDCNLKKAVEENVEFPLKDWNLDEFEVILE